jgi:uncharacterized protein YggE
MKTRSTAQLLVSLLLVASYLPISNTFAHDNQYPQNTIIVSGNGVVEAEPDVAILDLSIYSQRQELAQAKREADDKYRKTLAVLERANIAKQLIKATRINASPQYEWRNSQRIFKGYRVSRSLNVRIENIEKLSNIMQNLVENGVSSIDGVSTDFSNRPELVKQAIGMAADDAKDKAAFLARQLGRELGNASFISQTDHQAIQPRRQAYSMEAASSKVMSSAPPPQEQLGTEKITSRLTVHFDLL